MSPAGGSPCPSAGTPIQPRELSYGDPVTPEVIGEDSAHKRRWAHVEARLEAYTSEIPPILSPIPENDSILSSSGKGAVGASGSSGAGAGVHPAERQPEAALAPPPCGGDSPDAGELAPPAQPPPRAALAASASE